MTSSTADEGRSLSAVVEPEQRSVAEAIVALERSAVVNAIVRAGR